MRLLYNHSDESVFVDKSFHTSHKEREHEEDGQVLDPRVLEELPETRAVTNMVGNDLTS